VIGTSLVVAVALITPVFVTTVSTLASADMVVDGCTIVLDPTATNFTNCPGANLSTANLNGDDLSYANLAGATLVSCTISVASAVECTSATLSRTNLTSADLSGVSFAVCFQLDTGPLAPSGCGESTLSGIVVKHKRVCVLKRYEGVGQGV
jgi:Pentapeptide repeats (8 copies)